MDDNFPHSSPSVFHHSTLYPSHVTYKSLMMGDGLVPGHFIPNIPNQPAPMSLGNGELVARATNSADLSD